MASQDAVARIRQDPEHEERPELDEEVIDIDLDEIDEQLRAESVGKATVVRIGGVIVHIQHANDWSSTAMRALGNADYDDWAAEVIEDEKELKAFLDADLHNYQLVAIAREASRQARLNRGKSQRRSGSSRTGRKK